MRRMIWNIKEILDAPISGSNWYKKVVLWPFIVFVGLPVYLLGHCLYLLPILLGGGLLLTQSYRYLYDGKWPSFSILDVATYTVEPSLADGIGQPLLASCESFRNRLIPGGDGQILQPCPSFSSWQVWLMQPDSWIGFHEFLLPALNVASIALLFVITGIFFRSLFQELDSNVLLALKGPLQATSEPDVLLPNQKRSIAGKLAPLKPDRV
jgi:hypothetical protein